MTNTVYILSGIGPEDLDQGDKMDVLVESVVLNAGVITVRLRRVPPPELTLEAKIRKAVMEDGNLDIVRGLLTTNLLIADAIRGQTNVLEAIADVLRGAP